VASTLAAMSSPVLTTPTWARRGAHRLERAQVLAVAEHGARGVRGDALDGVLARVDGDDVVPLGVERLDDARPEVPESDDDVAFHGRVGQPTTTSSKA
jgi:hypothetical protein